MGVAAPDRSPGVRRSKTRQRGGQECQEGGIPGNEKCVRNLFKNHERVPVARHGLSRGPEGARGLQGAFYIHPGPSGCVFEQTNTEHMNDLKIICFLFRNFFCPLTSIDRCRAPGYGGLRFGDVWQAPFKTRSFRSTSQK